MKKEPESEDFHVNHDELIALGVTQLVRHVHLSHTTLKPEKPATELIRRVHLSHKPDFFKKTGSGDGFFSEKTGSGNGFFEKNRFG